MADEIKDVLWPSARWEVDLCDPETQSFIMGHIASGETLRHICADRGWPYSMVARWIAEDPEVNRAYDAALAIWGDSLAQETVGISDATQSAAEPHHVAAAKVRIDTRMKLASRWNRQRYGETPTVQINAQSGSLIAILAALPPVGAPEEIDVTPDAVVEKAEQKISVIPMELRETDELVRANKAKQDEEDGII